MFKFACPEEFLEAFRNGERAALERVYWAYVDDIERFARRFLRTTAGYGRLGTTIDVGDAVQEIFVKAFGSTARTSFDGSRSYGPYLAALARNLLVDLNRKSGWEVPTGDLACFEALPSSEHDANWTDAETVEVVTRYLAGLPQDLQAVHELRFVACQPQREVCSTLGLTRQALRTRENRLRSGLLRALARARLARAPLASAGLSFAARDGRR